MKVKMTYDAEIDALYIRLSDVAIDDSIDVEEGVTLDVSEDGKPVGLEILDVKKHLDKDSQWTSLPPSRANAM